MTGVQTCALPICSLLAQETRIEITRQGSRATARRRSLDPRPAPPLERGPPSRAHRSYRRAPRAVTTPRAGSLTRLWYRILRVPEESSGPKHGWGGRIRTSGCESQSLVPYRLATPHQKSGVPLSRGDLQRTPRNGRPTQTQAPRKSCISRRRLQGASPRCQFTGQGPAIACAIARPACPEGR